MQDIQDYASLIFGTQCSAPCTINMPISLKFVLYAH